jgi:hypothetical protein
MFKTREWLLGAHPDGFQRPRGLLRWAKSLGWEVLAEAPDRQIVLGAATRPWDADVVFRTITPVRRAALRAVKAEAERRAREGRVKSSDRFDLVSQGDLDPQC